MLQLVSKILISILDSVVIFICGLILLLMVALGGAGTFYRTFVVLGAVVVWLFLILQMWQLFKPRIRFISVAAAITLMGLAITGLRLTEHFYNSIEAGTENPHVERFIEWIVSDQSQHLVEKTEHTLMSLGKSD